MKTAFVTSGQGKSVWVLTDRVTIKARGADTAGAFTLLEIWVPPKGGTPPHVHSREDESFYVLDGEIEFRCDGQTFHGARGGWVMLPRGTLHQFLNTTSAPARMLVIASPAGIEDFFEAVGVESEQPVAVTNERIALLMATAPRYGIEIRVEPLPS
jgi:quercetin dioxygenase-like cupin family protein